jgi:tripartite-type tricarboxylate transporter receptor subunit TctC
MTFVSIAAALPFIESGKVRPIGVTSLSRVPMMPDVPAVAEYAPLAGFDIVNFFGFYAPANTPEPIVRKLNAAAVQGFKDPELVAKLKGLGFEPDTGTPEQFREFVKAKSMQFAKIIADANLKLEQ